MKISEIKTRLPMEVIFPRYGLKPDRNNRLSCPFHADKKPSMQYYPETGTVYCFSTNCPRHGHSLDVIDLVMYMEQCSKHEAIRICEALVRGESPGRVGKPRLVPPKKPGLAQKPQALPVAERIRILEQFYQNSLAAFSRSQAAKDYRAKRALDQTEMGFLDPDCFKNWPEADQKLGAALGLLKKQGKSYVPKFHSCLVLPLREPQGRIVDLYFRSISGSAKTRHFHLTGTQQGLYPGYPSPGTKTLVITEGILDAASWVCSPPEAGTEVLAFYGTGGDTAEHWQAMEGLADLEEIVFCLDGDGTGRKAAKDHLAKLASLPWVQARKLRLSQMNLADHQDINQLLQNKQMDNLHQAWQERKEQALPTPGPPQAEKKPSFGQLDTKNPQWLRYEGQAARYEVAGGIKKDLDHLRLSLHTSLLKEATGLKYRHKVDLYEADKLEKYAQAAAQKLGARMDLILLDLYGLTNLLEDYRAELLKGVPKEGRPAKKVLSRNEKDQAWQFLKQSGLMKNVNDKIGLAGVVGETLNRLFLLLIASSYKQKKPLHAILHGSSGSGKTHLIETVGGCIPEEDTYSITSASEMSFYHYGEREICHSFFKFQDLDGLPPEVQLALREMQSYLKIIRQLTRQDEDNKDNYTGRKTVYGPISSFGATTHGSVYEDNLNRCFNISPDEGLAQTRLILDHMCRQAKGMLNSQEAQQAQALLQDCVRMLEPSPVVNPYAGDVRIPEYVRDLRRLTGMFHAAVEQVVVWHQYQRLRDGQGRLIARKEDLAWAIRLMFESLVMKSDDLDGPLRAFFEQLKSYVDSQGNRHYAFKLREIRQHFHRSKSSVDRYIQSLVEMEYLERQGHANRGYDYKIGYWDDQAALRERIKRDMEAQLAKIKG